MADRPVAAGAGGLRGANGDDAKFCADATQNDPLHRSCRLTVFQLTADGARFKAWPAMAV